MKLEVKPVSGPGFELDGIELSTTVLVIKDKISALKGWERENQKLILKGKIMTDDKTLEDYGFKEGNFLVCMYSKPKKATTTTPTPSVAATTTSAAPSTPSAAPATTSTTTTSGAPITTNVTSPSIQSRTIQPSPTTTAPSAVNSGGNDMFSGPAFAASLAQLQDMGFGAEECNAALRAAFGNTDRAVEYLFNGIPANLQQQQQASMNRPPVQQQQQSQNTSPAISNPNTTAGTARPTPASSSSGGLDALRRSPFLNQLKAIVQNDPSKLGDILQQLSVSDPSLFQAIQNDQAGFVELMNEPIVEQSPGSHNMQGNDSQMGGDMMEMDAEGLDALVGEGGVSQEQLMMMMQAFQELPPDQRNQLAQALGSLPPEALQQIISGAGGMMQGSGGGGIGQLPRGVPPGGQVVSLTQEQLASVRRLQELGFSERSCVIALLACDNNEQLAADFLLTNPSLEEDDQLPGGNNSNNNNNQS